MRATLFFFFLILVLTLLLWVTLSGVWLAIGFLFLLFFVFISNGYPDTFILYFLGAREVRSGDEKTFFQAASQEAYKLAVPMPHLYFYNGTLERAFVLQNRNNVSLILNKSLLQKSTVTELNAICFELLLQVKKNMAPKRTKVMFMLGLFSWSVHSLVGIVLSLLPFKNVKKSLDWILSYFLHPLLDLLFRLILGKRYFKKLENSLNEFSFEKELLRGVGLKLEDPLSYYSLPSRKISELSSVNKSRHFQNILSLEFLPHEWDFLFRKREIRSVE